MPHLIESLEDRQLFAGGAPDSSYASDGRAALTFRVASATEAVTPAQLLTDAQGRSYVVATTPTTFQIERLTSSGVLDTGWGKRGSVVFTRSDDFAAGNDKAQLDAAGRLVLLLDNKLVRLTTTGAADAAFGSGGVTTLPSFVAVNDMTIDLGNRIYVTGTGPGNHKTIDARARLERLNSRGRIDKTFQLGGLYDLPNGTSTIGSSVTLRSKQTGQFVRALADGSVVVAADASYGVANGHGYSIFRVQSAKFAVDGTLVTSYGNLGTGFESAAGPSSDDYTTHTLSAVGIRASGAVSMLASTDPPFGAGAPFSSNEEISPTGQFVAVGSGTATYAAAGDTELAGFSNVAFTSLKDGRELVTLDGNSVAVLTAGGNYDTTFNGGKALSLPAERARVTGVAAAEAGDGNILTAKPGVDRFTVVVHKFLTTGPAGQTVPVTPAATPNAGGGKLTKAATSLQFNVVYYAKGGGSIDGSQLNGSELRVLAASGEHRIPRLVSYRAGGAGGIIATYRTTDTDGSAWDKTDNGLYGVRLIANTLKFSDGTFLPGVANIGTLQVAIV